MTFFGLLAVLLNILTMGGFIAIAVLTRSAVHSCSNPTIRAGPLGLAADSSFDNNITYSVSPRTACLLNKTVFIISIIGAFIFLICALVQLLLVRSAKKSKHVGPSPANDYTSGNYNSNNGGFFWKRKQRNDRGVVDLETKVPAGTSAAGGPPDMRPSYETSTTFGNNGGQLGGFEKEGETVVPAHANVYGHETATNTGTQHHHY
jgi:hypothetical protein